MLPKSSLDLAMETAYLPRVDVSDAGVYICEVNVRDTLNNPYVISQSGSVTVTFTVTSKL